NRRAKRPPAKSKGEPGRVQMFRERCTLHYLRRAAGRPATKIKLNLVKHTARALPKGGNRSSRSTAGGEKKFPSTRSLGPRLARVYAEGRAGRFPPALLALAARVFLQRRVDGAARAPTREHGGRDVTGSFARDHHGTAPLVRARGRLEQALRAPRR